MSTGESRHSPRPATCLCPHPHPWDPNGGQLGGLALRLVGLWSSAWLGPRPLAESSLHPPQGVSGRGASPDTGCSQQRGSGRHRPCVPVQP